ncbi:phage tail tape measure protein [Salibacterium aidingense]|uniref:phage tail tape measure protein n=1 Tax=Salibacterium aidingense TaxID=384933 RepID=UPI003BC692EA
MAYDLTAAIRLNDKYSAPMRKATKSTETFEKATKGAGQSLKNAGKSMRSAGKNMSKYLTAPLAGVATGAIATVATFDDSMAKVQAISGATGDSLEKLRQQAQDLGSTTAHSASQVADAQSYMALAGWETNQILEATPGLLSLASAGQLDLAATSDIVTDTMSSFRMEADRANEAADIFAQTQSKANTSVDQLGQAMTYAGGEAGAAGMTLAETSAILGTFANTGLKGSKAGTTFTSILRDMRNAAEDGKLSVGDMSVALYDAEGDMRDMGSVLTDIEEATKGMDDATRDAALSTIFQTEAMKGVNSFIQQGSGVYEELQEAIEGSDGAASDAAETMEDTLGGSFRAMRSAIEGFMISIGDDLKGYVRQGADIISELANAFTDLSPNIRKAAIVFGLIAAIIPPIIFGLGVVATVLGALSGPIIGVVAGIGLLVGALVSAVTGSESFKKGLITNFLVLRDSFMEVVSVVGEKLRSFWTEHGKPMADMLLSGFRSLGEALIDFWYTHGHTIVSTVGSVFTSILDFILSVFGQVSTFFQNEGSMILQAIKNIATFVGTVFMAIWPAISAVIQAVWGNIKAIITGAIGVITGIIKVFAALFTGNWKALWEGVKQIVSNGVQVLWNLFQLWIGGRIVQVVKGAAGLLVRIFGKQLGRLVSSARKLLAKVRDFFKRMFNRAKESVGTALSAAGKAVGKFFRPLMSFLRKARNLWGKFTDALKNFEMPDAVKGVVSGIGNVARGVGGLIPGNYHGIDRVPYDGYTTRLHKDETVLPRQEAKSYREGRGGGNGGGVVVNFSGDINVRSDDDIDRISEQLARKITTAQEGGA